VPTTSLVLAAESVKIIGCLAAFQFRKDSGGWAAFRGWNLRGSLVAAGLPSVTYVFQNYCVQIAYQNLDGVVFNVLNQSKILFTAIFVFLIAGRRQSPPQIVALVLVTCAGILVSMPKADETAALSRENQDRQGLGVMCALAAAALSGVGSGITEWALRNGNRNNYLLSLELAAMGLIVILGGLLTGVTADGAVWRTEGLFTRWRFVTVVPVMAQGLSGILVGIVTKISGGVRKVLATICGLILTCFIQQLVYGGYPSFSVILAVPLVASGVYLHATNPPKVSSAEL